jgi:hypothetical protein
MVIDELELEASGSAADAKAKLAPEPALEFKTHIRACKSFE